MVGHMCWDFEKREVNSESQKKKKKLVTVILVSGYTNIEGLQKVTKMTRLT